MKGKVDMSNSSAIERVMDEVLFGAGCLNLVNSAFTTKELYEVAMQTRPSRVENVASKKGVSLERMQRIVPKVFLDHVYGIDSVVEIPDKGINIKLGFDWTLNADDLASKVSKLKEFAPMWQAIGIQSVAVVLIKLKPNFEGLGFMQKFELQALGDQFTFDVLFDLAEAPPASVCQYTLTMK